MKRPLLWRKREYPWTPDKKDSKSHPASFAAYRSGVLPIIERNANGQCELVYVDVRTKEGIKQYDAAHRAAISDGGAK